MSQEKQYAIQLPSSYKNLLVKRTGRSRLSQYNQKFHYLDQSQTIATQKLLYHFIMQLRSIERSFLDLEEEYVEKSNQGRSITQYNNNRQTQSEKRVFAPTLKKTTITPNWLFDRKDFKKLCYSQQIQNFLYIPKVCLKQSRTITEQDNLKQWLKDRDCLIGLPKEFYDLSIKYIKTNIVNNQERIKSTKSKMILYNGLLENQQEKYIIHSGQVLLQNINYKAKCDSILLELDFCDLQIILETIKRNMSDEMIRELKLEKPFQLFHSFEIYKLIQAGTCKLYFKDEEINNEQCVQVVMIGEIIRHSQKNVNTINKWPVGNNAWEVKEFIKKINKTDIIKPFKCLDYYHKANSRIIAQTNLIIILFRREQFEQILTDEQQNQMIQQIELQYSEALNWKLEFKRKFDIELKQKKQRIQKMMKQLLEQSSASDLN